MMYREKLMPGPGASPLDKFDAMQMRFASGSAGKKEKCLRDSLTKPDFDFLLSAERCPVTARPEGTERNERESEGISRRIMRGRSSAG
jgi:hypothetical protein